MRRSLAPISPWTEKRARTQAAGRVGAASVGVQTIVLALLGCTAVPDEPPDSNGAEQADDGGEPPKLESELEPGLILRDAERADVDGHLVEILVHEGYAYTANSLGIVTMRLDDDGGLTMTDNGKAAAGQWTSCTTIAMHRASDSLYCSADGPSMGPPRIELYSLVDPSAPVLQEPFLLEPATWAVRDLEVVGDRLLINQFDDGLWTADIDALGQLGELTQAPVEGNVRFTVAAGGRLVAALADVEGSGTQLRVLDAETFAELDRLSLAGPPLGLSVDAEASDVEAGAGPVALAVALGSGGMAIVELEHDALRLRERLEPPAVVSHALLSGELAFAITLSGAFAYELGDTSPRMFGFGPESAGAYERHGNMLHAVLHDGELLTSDWTWIQRWSVDPGGEVLALDVPRGVYVPPLGPVRWRLRNPGPVALRAEHWVGDRRVLTVELDPGEVETIELDVVARATILERDEPSVTIALRVHDPSVDSSGKPVSISSMMILQRDRDDPLPPAVGEPLTTSVTLADIDHELFELPPEPARRVQLIWYSPDCALMWPEFEDLAWLVRSGIDHGRGDPIYISPADVSYGFARRWGLEAVEFGLYGHEAPPEVDAANAAFGGEDLLGVFIVAALPGNADVSDTVLDADGTVVSIERMYRGAWSLAVPAPW